MILSGCGNSKEYFVTNFPKVTFEMREYDNRYDDLYEFFIHANVPGVHILNGRIAGIPQVLIIGTYKLEPGKVIPRIPLKQVVKVKAYSDLIVVWLQ